MFYVLSEWVWFNGPCFMFSKAISLLFACTSGWDINLAEGFGESLLMAFSQGELLSWIFKARGGDAVVKLLVLRAHDFSCADTAWWSWISC